MGDLRHLWTDAFLAALREHGLLNRASLEAGIDRVTVWNRRKADQAFDQAVKDAIEHAADKLEQEARRRALEGEAEPVMYQGQPTYVLETDEAGYPIYDTVREERYTLNEKGQRVVELVDVKRPRRKLDANGQPIIMTVRKRSDPLLALLLKGRRKDVFADRTELTGANGGPVDMLDDNARAARAAALLKLAQQRQAADDEIA